METASADRQHDSSSKGNLEYNFNSQDLYPVGISDKRTPPNYNQNVWKARAKLREKINIIIFM